MSKLISQLPEDVRVVALQRQREAVKYWDKKTDELRHAFNWVDTPEKYEIWAEVNCENYEPFREFHAKQKQAENNGWIKLNGIAGEMPEIDAWVCRENGEVFFSPKGKFIPLNTFEYYMPIIRPEPPTPKN
jgi:hypothetical protein